MIVNRRAMLAMPAAIAAVSALSALAQEQEQRVWNPLDPYDSDTVIGSADAPVTVVEYMSLTCPFCARFHIESLPVFKQGWIDTGKARLVVRQLPLDQAAFAGALALSCVDDAHRPALIEEFIGNVSAWASTSNVIPQVLRATGNEGNPGFGDQVIACISEDGRPEAVMTPGTDAVNNGIRQTPSFIVKDRLIEGFRTGAELGAAVDEALASAR